MMGCLKDKETNEDEKNINLCLEYLSEEKLLKRIKQ